MGIAGVEIGGQVHQSQAEKGKKAVIDQSAGELQLPGGIREARRQNSRQQRHHVEDKQADGSDLELGSEQAGGFGTVLGAGVLERL
jgi:hypothetical protein